MWIVFDNDNGADIFKDYEDALKCYEEAIDWHTGHGEVDPHTAVYISKVKSKTSWREDDSQPIYVKDECGDETEEESGEYYWTMQEEHFPSWEHE